MNVCEKLTLLASCYYYLINKCIELFNEIILLATFSFLMLIFYVERIGKEKRKVKSTKMMNQAIRKRLLMSHESFSAKRWEGKNLKFQFKFLVANYPELLLASFTALICAPLYCAYTFYTFEGSREHALSKYRAFYTVVRHDDPSVERLMKQKELGKQYFPE